MQLSRIKPTSRLHIIDWFCILSLSFIVALPHLCVCIVSSWSFVHPIRNIFIQRQYSTSYISQFVKTITHPYQYSPLNQYINGDHEDNNNRMNNDSPFIDPSPSFANLCSIVSSLGLQNARFIPSTYSPKEIEKEVELMDKKNNHTNTTSISSKSRIIHIKSLIFEIVWIHHQTFVHGASSKNNNISQTNNKDDTKHKVTQSSRNKDYFVVILQENQMVDIDKLTTAIIQSNEIFIPLQVKAQIQTLQLVSSSLLLNITGFKAGIIPPIGHHYPSYPLITIVDNQLLLFQQKDDDDDDSYYMKKDKIFIIGGGGHENLHILLRLESIPNAYLFHISKNHKVTTADVQHLSILDQNCINYNNNNNKVDKTKNRVKSYFPLCPPLYPLSSSMLLPISSSIIPIMTATTTTTMEKLPVTVTFVGRITHVRQIAKRLVFCDVAPIIEQQHNENTEPSIIIEQQDHHHQFNNNNNSFKDLPWVSGVDGQAMGIQVIMGKTLCRTLGDIEGTKAMKTLKVGQELVITGNINILTFSSSNEIIFATPPPSTTSSLSSSSYSFTTNWLEKRILDISVISYITLPKRLYKYNNRPSVMERTSTSSSSTYNVNGDDSSTESNPSLQQSFTDLPFLNMEHVFGPSFSIEIIDSINTISSFTHSIQHISSDSTDYDLVGIDCEWQPSGLYSSSIEENPVALLQVCFYSQKKIFLLDLMTLLRHHQNKTLVMNYIENEISSSLALLFQSRNLFKVGFQIASDLRRLASSFPHMKVFQDIESVVELSTIARKMIQRSFNPSLSRTDTASLRRLCITVLGFDLSKTEQISNWARRPLSIQQRQYAALDSAVSPHILQTLLSAGLNELRSVACILLNKDYSSFVSSWRFTVFTSGKESLDTDMSLIINHLKASRVTGESYVVSQSWITGHTPLNPPSLSLNSFVDKCGVLRVLPHSIQLFGPKESSSQDWIEIYLAKREPGLTSKDKCLNLVLKQSYSASLQPGIYREAKLDYNTRSGYVELKDAVIIFVNMPKVDLDATPLNPFWQRYPNTWQNNGRVLTWYLREYEWNHGKTELAQKLLSVSGVESSDASTTLLFIRHDKNDYNFYGRCSVSTPTSACKPRTDSLIQLYLHLIDFDLLYNQVQPDAMNGSSTLIISK